ncbi:hypothetical protein [Flavobacterium tegetincola]|uniref:hypothetical protein n=1 Tax=Flavobacterium tegetincola TaxID=150172 RepID=UPI0004021916|nr:hypothetical protein [Flavobacterium tegetincola]
MKYLLIIVAGLMFTSCSKGQIKEEVGLTNKLVYNEKASSYTVTIYNAYQAQILINGFPILPVLVSQGLTYLDMGIEKTGTQKLEVILDLSSKAMKNYTPKGDDKILTIELDEDDDQDDGIYENFEILYSDLTEEDLKKHYYVKEIEFKAKPAYHFFKEEDYVDLRKEKNLKDSLYARYKAIVADVNDKNAKAFVKKIEVAEYQSSQLRNMKPEWVINERERFFNNKLKLYPIDSCKIRFTENYKMATLQLIYNPITREQNALLSAPALRGFWKKESIPYTVTYMHNFYFAKPKSKNHLELLRWNTFTYDMDM